MPDNIRNLDKALSGDGPALTELLAGYRDRLKRFARFRLSSQLRRRIDESDVVQEAFIEVAKRLSEFDPDQGLTFYHWVRHLVGRKASELHRHHIKTQARDARREIHGGQFDEGGSLFELADRLVDSMTSPSQAVRKQELRQHIRAALKSMDETDQEILYLRHFEQLTTQETADVVGLSKAGAGSRYLRALQRLKSQFEQSNSGSDGKL